MEKEPISKQAQLLKQVRFIYDIFISLLILSMGIVMFLAVRLHLDEIINLDEPLRYMFGAICLLYGSFRMYRGIKGDR